MSMPHRHLASAVPNKSGPGTPVREPIDSSMRGEPCAPLTSEATTGGKATSNEDESNTAGVDGTAEQQEMSEAERRRAPSPPRRFANRDVVRLTLLDNSPWEAPVHERPRTRADCEHVPRPCPYVGCRHHLFLDVDEGDGSIRLNFPDREPDELTESCSLDLAERGGFSLEETAELLNVSAARLQQLEQGALRRGREKLATMGIREAQDLLGVSR